ncbi:DUF4251 domain-containing protein [Pedobacter petrophilus]|uniref:DUF4251 domain-containing protein n=1 Tax=Pedobacter petrophilus TaxID=1908241 RepID=A0A7K0FYU6_9SPHI|nr:DUF4251 domain-containing protein [Pedobacter petrophilus]MRX76149.1 DUF4251 domain-containing protein [Pedobacter petrophilus]
MKHLKLVLSMALFACSLQLFAQTNKATTIKIIEEKDYTFVANSAIPMSNMDVSQILSRMPGSQGGGMINLTGSQYDFIVTKDSVVAYLPYYGRSFSPPLNPNEGGIKFTSKDFSYKETKNKKGNYNIQINTKDLKRENFRLSLSVTPNGYATLVASGYNKQPITFNGYLSESKKKDQ